MHIQCGKWRYRRREKHPRIRLCSGRDKDWRTLHGNRSCPPKLSTKDRRDLSRVNLVANDHRVCLGSSERGERRVYRSALIENQKNSPHHSPLTKFNPHHVVILFSSPHRRHPYTHVPTLLHLTPRLTHHCPIHSQTHRRHLRPSPNNPPFRRRCLQTSLFPRPPRRCLVLILRRETRLHD